MEVCYRCSKRTTLAPEEHWITCAKCVRRGLRASYLRDAYEGILYLACATLRGSIIIGLSALIFLPPILALGWLIS